MHFLGYVVLILLLARIRPFPQVPPPPAVSDAELAHAVATLDNSKYRVPMSVGEPHAELDTAKKGCTAYDVIVSEEAFAEFQAREGVREFMVELMLSHIEAKFNTRLCRDYKVCMLVSM